MCPKPQDAKPLYQRSILWISWLLLGVVIMGNIIGAVNDALQLVSPLATYLATAGILIFWLCLEVVPHLVPLKWAGPTEQLFRVRRIGAQIRLTLTGAIALIWIPRLAGFADSDQLTRVIQVVVLSGGTVAWCLSIIVVRKAMMGRPLSRSKLSSALAGLVLFPLLAVSLQFKLRSWPFSEQTILIVLAPFESGGETGDRAITRILYEQIKSSSRSYPDIRIEVLSS